MSQTLESFKGGRAEDFRTPYQFIKYVQTELMPQAANITVNGKLVFDLDVAAEAINSKGLEYFDEKIDGLKQEWFGHVWCNPPYGRKITSWLEKAAEQRKNCEAIWVLIPARTEVKWFHDIVMKEAHTVYLIKGRINFRHHSSVKNSNAPFPSMLIKFSPRQPLNKANITVIAPDSKSRGFC